MRIILTALLLTLSLWSVAQEKASMHGTITDAASGEELIGAALFLKELGTGTTTNVYGFYSLTVPAGTYSLEVSFLGYEKQSIQLDLTQDVKMDFELAIKGTTITEFEVTGEVQDENVESLDMSTVKMPIETIKQIPALLGEVDVIKAIQMLPGVQTVGEGNSGFYVRGGGVDQNLILLDEAPVYNASHLMGFFSVFNSDAIKDVQLYKGGIPAEYGGRLSSVLDIRMKEGNNKKFHGTGGIGTISSRLTLEGPIVKDKSSFIVSGRRTYADLFLKLAKDTNLRENKLYFYDLNAKANYTLGENDRIFASGYFGRDVFAFGDEFKMTWGNQTGTLRWNHVYNKKLFSNLTLIYSNFDYFLGATSGPEAFSWNSDIRDYSGKLDFHFFPNPSHTIRFGAQTTYHKFNPGFVKGEGDETIFNELQLDKVNAWEQGIYISNDHKISSRLSARYGLRYSHFTNVGPGTVYSYDDAYMVTDTTTYNKGDFYQNYGGLEPRLGLKYSLTDETSLKMSYNRTIQYVHLASNSTSASPLDIWFPSSPNVKPQIADQIAAGYFRNFKENKYEVSVELYYKDMRNTIDFKNHATLLLNPLLEGELRFGRGRSYGLEFLLRKQQGKFTGWLSYTLARTEKNIPDVEEDWYPTKYDKTHDISLIMSYKLNDRLSFATNWVYATGSAVTMPTGRFEYGGIVVPVYSDRNGARMPAYHRMDLAVTLKGKEKEGQKWHNEWVFSVYNAYFRKNPYSINFREDADNPGSTYAEMTYLFGIVPAITYNFNF